MNILILTQFYPPESGAPQNRLSDLARRLSDMGHTVTVLTAMPNYPTGKVFPEWRGKLFSCESAEGVRILRTWIYPATGRRFLPRIFNYFSFVFSSIIMGFWRTGPLDYVITESPPLFLGISGWLFSRLRRARLIMNISDLWPESAVALGVVTNPILIGASTQLEMFLYRSSRFITGQTAGIVSNISNRIPGKPVILMTNGVDIQRFPPRKSIKSSELEAEFKLEGIFVAGYAGLLGLAQGLETVIEAGRLLRDHPGVVIALFGSGPEKDRLSELSKDLPNIRIFPPQPSRRVPEILSLFDVALIPLKKNDLFRGALPSKMFEAMASELPLVLSVEGEAEDLIRHADAGICVRPEDPRAMADAIILLLNDQKARVRMGTNGRTHVFKHYNREHIARNFANLLEEHYDR